MSSNLPFTYRTMSGGAAAIPDFWESLRGGKLIHRGMSHRGTTGNRWHFSPNYDRLAL
jgi:hypothetical protein